MVKLAGQLSNEIYQNEEVSKWIILYVRSLRSKRVGRCFFASSLFALSAGWLFVPDNSIHELRPKIFFGFLLLAVTGKIAGDMQKK